MDTKAFEKDVRKIRDKCRDAIDDQSDGTCRQMMNQLQKLEDEAQVGKSKGTLHARLKDMRRTAEQLVDCDGMSYSDADTIRDWVEDALRKTR